MRGDTAVMLAPMRAYGVYSITWLGSLLQESDAKAALLVQSPPGARYNCRVGFDEDPPQPPGRNTKAHAVPLEIQQGKAAVPGAARGAHVSFPPSFGPVPPVTNLLHRGLRLGGYRSADAGDGGRRGACLTFRPARIPHPGRQVIVFPRSRCVFAGRTFLCRNEHLRNCLQIRHGPRARRQRILHELSLRQLIG